MKDIIIMGAGGFARELHDWLQDKEGINIVAFFAEFSDQKRVKGIEVIGNLDKHKHCDFYVGVGEPQLRKKFYDLGIGAGLNLAPAFVHSSVVVGRENQFAEGVIICPNSTVTTNVGIGVNSMLNINTTIGHDTILGDHCVVSPGANISGNVKVGNFCDLGTNCSIRPKISICDDVVVGLGGGVVKDILEPGIYTGIPVKKRG